MTGFTEILEEPRFHPSPTGCGKVSRPMHYEPDRGRAGLCSVVVPDPVFPDQSTCRGPAGRAPCCTVQRRPRSPCAPPSSDRAPHLRRQPAVADIPAQLVESEQPERLGARGSSPLSGSATAIAAWPGRVRPAGTAEPPGSKCCILATAEADVQALWATTSAARSSVSTAHPPGATEAAAGPERQAGVSMDGYACDRCPPRIRRIPSAGGASRRDERARTGSAA